MSVLTDIGRYITALATEGFSAVVEAIRTAFVDNREKRRKVAFSVALIALSAKMAKADGVVTENEVDAFRDIFHVPDEELANVSRLYNLAKQDVAGFPAYAQQVRNLFPGDDPGDRGILHDVLDALFHIAKADDVLHENEFLFLEEIAVIFGFEAAVFERIKMRHVGGECDPYAILHAEPDWDFERLKSHYRKRVMECHPDRLIARGVPDEFVVIANDRLAAINAAWERISRQHDMQKRVEPVG